MYKTRDFLDSLVAKYPLPRSDIKPALLLVACNADASKKITDPRFMIVHRVGYSGGGLARTGGVAISE